MSINILDFADIINIKLIVERHPNQNGRWTASFENSEIKNSEQDICLRSIYGDAISPELAIMNYSNEISGKILVINSMTDKRKDLNIPNLK